MTDRKKPAVTRFELVAFNGPKGNGVKVTYGVKDSGGSHLARVELWRKGHGSDWKEIKRNDAKGHGGTRLAPGHTAVHACDRQAIAVTLAS